jgi:chemotaxis signal transduction protein
LHPELGFPITPTGHSVDTGFISGLAKRDSDFVVILDTKKLFAHEEIATAAKQKA